MLQGIDMDSTDQFSSGNSHLQSAADTWGWSASHAANTVGIDFNQSVIASAAVYAVCSPGISLIASVCSTTSKHSAQSFQNSKRMCCSICIEVVQLAAHSTATPV